MKKFIALFILLLSLTAHAQKDVTTFMGIPVDGTEAEMKKALLQKGFKYEPAVDCIYGKFNGRLSYIHIVTNNNKVSRIIVEEGGLLDENKVKTRFNKLVRKFDKDKKYTKKFTSDYIIPEDENIEKGIESNELRYVAAYLQATEHVEIDTTYAYTRVAEIVFREFTPEQVKNPTEAQQQKIQKILEEESKKIINELLAKKSVWFMINRKYGMYNILLYYDNEYNRTDG